MSYLVLARKYRPQTFDEVVGQEHVTRTLANSVASGRVAHAILFSGPRGTGKTTVARVLAKILNCEQNKTAPRPFPCNQCKSCQQITTGNASDVFEIDGASNNSVDQIRELRENVKYMPVLSPYKIYIIDEVHMLSIAAFNALLKTLEEPPPHVKFMFATTEIHKIPVTILSRCQRHDMRRVDFQDIVNHMESLCKKEACDVPMESLGIIARESGGSVRDALSLLDQVVSCAQGSIEHEQVLGILGVVDRKMIFDMSGAVIDRNMEKILTIIDDIYSRGQEIKKLYNDLTEHFRNLLVASMGGDAAKNINLPAYEISLLLEQARNCPPPWISMILDKLFEGEAHIRYASNPRLALEMVFFKIHQVKPALPIEALIHKLDLLQKQAEKNSGRPAEIHGGSVTPQSDSEMPRQMVHDAHVPDTGKAIPAQGSAVQNTYQAVDLNDTGVAESVSPGTSVFSRFNPDDSLEKNWQNFLVSFKKDAPSLAPILSKSVLKNISGQSIEIEVRTNPFNISRIKDNKNTGIIDNSLTQFFGRNVVSAIETITDTSDSSKQRSIRNEKLKKEAIENPVIAEAIRQFGGKVEIKILEGDKK